MSNPLPKLCNFPMAADEATIKLRHVKGDQNYTPLEKDITAPIGVSGFNTGYINGNVEEILNVTEKELTELGINYGVHTHTLTNENGRETHEELILFVPHFFITDKKYGKYGEHRTETDVEGRAAFLAYLMAKGWVKEQEDMAAIKNTFGVYSLRLAKSAAIQDKIRHVLGAESLPENPGKRLGRS